jgi:hypothetical protein
MTLSVTSWGDNPQQPGIRADAFIPDQLIAGNLKLVTDNVTLTGSAPLQRGSVLGRSSYGAISAATGTAYASGTITLAALPTPGDTLTIGGTAINFVTPIPFVQPQGNTVYIGTTTALTAQALLALLEGSTDANLVKFTYALAGSVLTATAATIGTAGNALTLATSDSGAFTLSGATLSGGVANTGNATVGTMSAGAAIKAGNYTAVCLTATTAQVYSPTGDELGVTTFGAQFVNPELSFKITAGGTPCVAGDTFVLLATPNAAGIYKLCTASAVDGSEIPAAILVDYSDPSAGNVITGVYLMGEFNGNAIILDPSISLASVKAAFTGKGIFIKTSVSAYDPT